MEEFAGKTVNADFSYSEAALLDVDTLLVSNLLDNIAWHFIKKNQHEEAILSFKKSIAVNHRNTKASYALAELLTRLNRQDEAIEFFRYTVHKNPAHSDAFRRLGDLYTQQEEFEAAFYYYLMSLEQNYNQPVLHYIVGQIYYNHKRDYVNAIRHFQISLEMDPNHYYNKQARQTLRNLEPKIN
jgi:tetratricopeptide (TPR) repeat protein